MLFYRAALPLSRRTLNVTTRLIRAHRQTIRSRWRRLAPDDQAPLALLHLRKGETPTSVAAGFSVGTATAWRYICETTALLAEHADPRTDHRCGSRGSFPGSVHDLRAARAGGLLRRLRTSGVLALADKGYIGAGEKVFVPFKGRGKPAWKKQVNREYARLRAPGERANAALKSWKVLAKLRCRPHHAGQIVRAALVLQQTESR